MPHYVNSHPLLARLVRPSGPDTRQTISDMSNNLQALQGKFVSNLNLHTAFVSMRILDGVETLGMADTKIPAVGRA